MRCGDVCEKQRHQNKRQVTEMWIQSILCEMWIQSILNVLMDSISNEMNGNVHGIFALLVVC